LHDFGFCQITKRRFEELRKEFWYLIHLKWKRSRNMEGAGIEEAKQRTVEFEGTKVTKVTNRKAGTNEGKSKTPKRMWGSL